MGGDKGDDKGGDMGNMGGGDMGEEMKKKMMEFFGEVMKSGDMDKLDKIFPLFMKFKTVMMKMKMIQDMYGKDDVVSITKKELDFIDCVL